MRLEDLDYDLPPDRIAQTPAEPRDASRLMVVNRSTGSIDHHVFADLPNILSRGDLLVANDSRVLPARLRGRKETGGIVEVLLLSELNPTTWTALIRGRTREGTRIRFGDEHGSPSAVVARTGPGGSHVLEFDRRAVEVMDSDGVLPLPPYIRAPMADDERYQTVYARLAGSSAAPTAGLHFTEALLHTLRAAGIGMAFVTLNVGADTFVPVKVPDLAQHPIHSEWCAVPQETWESVVAARALGGRSVAVGTTSVRALETAHRTAGAYEGWTDLFILPPYSFRAVDALITNFHLPRTTLLALVAAFAGQALVREAYDEAIRLEYRFFSFGDAMLIL